jgi:hypothetical protein
MLGLVICNIVLGGGLELLVQFKEFMYPKLGMIHDFHFVWILRALSFKVTWYVSPPQMCPFASSWSYKHAFGRSRAELIISKSFILICQLHCLYAVPTLLL